MNGYKAPPEPKVGDRVHKTGPNPTPGEVLAILPDELWGRPIFVVRYWWKHKQTFHHECINYLDWELGLVRPGPVPEKIDGQWPWVVRP